MLQDSIVETGVDVVVVLIDERTGKIVLMLNRKGDLWRFPCGGSNMEDIDPYNPHDPTLTASNTLVRICEKMLGLKEVQFQLVSSRRRPHKKKQYIYAGIADFTQMKVREYIKVLPAEEAFITPMPPSHWMILQEVLQKLAE